MKKTAFSYLEIIIAILLVAMVAVLTAPFMTYLVKEPTPQFGEFKCYARYVEGEGWLLFQNTRVNTDTYMSEDSINHTQEGTFCEFKKPSGDISQFTVTIYGGGGSGSTAYFDTVKDKFISLAPGASGEKGEIKTKIDSLKEVLVDDILTISICGAKNHSNAACIGKGGEINTKNGGASSIAPKERLISIKESLNNGNINTSDTDYLISLNIEKLTDATNRFLNNATSSKMKERLKNEIDNCINSNTISDTDNSRYTGKSGEETRFLLSNGDYLIAKGGKYGESNKYTNSKEYNLESFAQHSKNDTIYFIPKNAKQPEITGGRYSKCEGLDANNPNQTFFENYGAAGQGGLFVCKFTGDIDENNINPDTRFGSDNLISDNYCYAGLGGRGAGGAIIIKWN